MADEFSLKLDLSEVIAYYKDLTSTIQEKLGMAAQGLAIQAHAHVKEQAAQKLHTRLQMFNDNLDFQQIDKRTWAIIVKSDARWIEDGMDQHSMLDDLLKSDKAKTAKDGSRYLVIPFKHNKGPTQTGPGQKQMLQELKKELKARKIPYSKPEKNPDGSPKVGLLHKMDLNGPNQNRHQSGQGPHGRPFAANTNTAAGHEGPSGLPYLYGVRIYQHLQRNPDGSAKMDKRGNNKVSREIMTFRVASSKQSGTNKWFHPGVQPMRLLDEAYEWAKDQWDNHIAPEIISSLGV